jgi:hypothetical protein
MIDSILENRKCVREYDTNADIPETLINSLLRRTWKVTPSKNQFMPYTVHVLGPKHQDYKNSVYLKCLSTENDQCPNVIPEIYQSALPIYANILSCSYLLIFTMRLEDKPNNYQKRKISQGFYFEPLSELGLKDIESSTSVEVGMFSDTFSALCIEQGLDVSYTLCFKKNLGHWKDLPFITRRPIFLMTVGKGKIYHRDHLIARNVHLDHLRPDYERIVNFVDRDVN